MSFLRNFFKKLFGDGKQKSEITDRIIDYDPSRREKKREERILAAEERLKVWIIASLRDRKNLPFSWESGNDEAFLTFQNATDVDKENFEDLEEYIIDRLDIPSAGEFQMNGSGNIYLEGTVVKVQYSSTMKGLIDFNEETQEEIYSEEELDSGDEVLFAI